MFDPGSKTSRHGYNTSQPEDQAEDESPWQPNRRPRQVHPRCENSYHALVDRARTSWAVQNNNSDVVIVIINRVLIERVSSDDDHRSYEE